ncbi:MAG: PhzF family phenazine biosynthesis protein [Maricaulaceae bacterium]
MPALPVFQFDAFADRLFQGNQAAVTPLDGWLEDAALQAIAAENNFAETAFIVPTETADRWKLRWFTPETEVPLCGHATLASGAAVLTELAPALDRVTFETRSGDLVVARDGARFTLDLPAREGAMTPPPDGLSDALGHRVSALRLGEYGLVEIGSEAAVRGLSIADGVAAARLVPGDRPGCLIVTAKADTEGLDFVSRFFAPGVGLEEDAATGSSFCDLGPYWADRLGKTEMEAFQASRRGAPVGVRVMGDRVILSGGAVLYLKGEIQV